MTAAWRAAARVLLVVAISGVPLVLVGSPGAGASPGPMATLLPPASSSLAPATGSLAGASPAASAIPPGPSPAPPAAPASPSAGPDIVDPGDPRSEGEGPGLVGSPVVIALAVVGLGLVTMVGTIVGERLTRRD